MSDLDTDAIDESVAVVIEFRTTRFVRSAIQKWASRLYLAGEADTDGMSEFVRTAVREKIQREKEKLTPT